MATLPTEVIEAVEETINPEVMEELLMSAQNSEFALQIIAGFLLFFTVVALCYFCYKFFRIFF